MPMFPGMGYPLVPGYESVGRISEAGPTSGHQVGERVFVPGARCFGEVRGLFGGAASRLVVPGQRVFKVSDELGEHAVLLALAATAYHAVAGGGQRDPIVPPDLIVGHGVLGRLLARMTVLADYPAPTVWETCKVRSGGADGYKVIHPDEDDAPQLQVDLRRQRRCADPRPPDRAPGARRRSGAGGLLQRAAALLVPAGLHARSADPRGGGMEARPTCWRCANSPRAASCRSTA